MELLKADDLYLNNGTKDILINTSFRILEGQKIGLIGPNGVGKTTLIKLILGELEQDSGSLFRKKDLNVGYLPQQPDYKKTMPIKEFLLIDLAPILAKLNHFENQMNSAEDKEMELLLQDYQTCCDEFDSLGGYIALERGENLLKKLGLDNSMDQEMGSLSGGERSLVFFAKALISNPELLILDEPGNHLDYLGLAWLESFIQGYKGAILIVSHNRYLLDKTTDILFDMFNGKLGTFKGNYSALRLEKLRQAVIEKNAYEHSVKKIEKIRQQIKELQSIAMSQYNPPKLVITRLNDAKRRLKQELERGLEKPVIDNEDLKIDFGIELSKSDIAMQVSHFNFAYTDNELFKDASLEIKCREKVALVGPNGIGKSTFIKTILNSGDWNDKDLRIGPSQVVGYLSQTPSFASGAKTIQDEIRSWGALTEVEAFGLAKHFSFSFKDMEKSLKVLSGGEVNRLQLARLMYQKTNFLVLDEPTNHMDINSREMIEEAISKFQGTVLVISHDRFFLDQLVNRVIDIEDKRFISYEGNFSSYFKSKYPILPRLNGEIRSRGSERKGSTNPRTTENIEHRIEVAEKEKLSLEKDLKNALERNNQQAGRRIAVKLEQLSKRLNKLYDEWT